LRIRFLPEDSGGRGEKEEKRKGGEENIPTRFLEILEAGMFPGVLYQKKKRKKKRSRTKREGLRSLRGMPQVNREGKGRGGRKEGGGDPAQADIKKKKS